MKHEMKIKKEQLKHEENRIVRDKLLQNHKYYKRDKKILHLRNKNRVLENKEPRGLRIK